MDFVPLYAAKRNKPTLQIGCLGCYWFWNERRDGGPSEGQCSRCKRCLRCCDDQRVKYTCAWRFAQKSLSQKAASAKAYERYHAHPTILRHNRRMT